MASKRFKVKNGVTYRYHVAAEGYTTPTGVQNPGYITINGQPQPITIELVPATNFYSFTIYTDTANTVVINDEQIYDTGHTGQFTKSNIAEGTQIIYEVSRNGYNSEDNTDNPIILNQDTDINITLTPAVNRLTVNVNGYDNVQGTTTNITQSCTFTFTVNGQTTTTSDNYIDVQANTTVKFNVVCSGYTEKLYSQGGTLPLDHYVTVGDSPRIEPVNMEKSTNQYTVTWNVVDGAGNPITGYEINVTVNDGTTHSIPGNTYTGTINDKIVWSCGIDQQHTVDGGVIYHLTSDQTLTATLRGQTYTAEVTVVNGPTDDDVRVEDARVRFINTSTQQYEEVLTNSNGIATYGVEYGVIYNVAVSKDGFWNEPTQDEIAIYPTYPYRVYKNDTITQLSISVSIYPSTTFWEFSVVPTPNTPVTVTMNDTRASVIRPTTDGDSYGGLFPPRTLVNYEITTTLPGYQSLSGSEYINSASNFIDVPKTLPAAQTGTATFTATDDDSGASITGFTLYVDGVQQSGNTYTDVVGSSHTYRLVKTGYQDATGGFTISSTSVPVPCIMRVDVSDYLTMELTDSDDRLYVTVNTGGIIDYTKNEGVTWTPLTGGRSAVNASVGDIIRFRINPSATKESIYKFSNYKNGTSTVNVWGNVSSVCYNPSAVVNNRFEGLFSGLDVANKYVNGVLKPIILDNITISEHCYYQMFQNCAHLTVAPELPATTLAVGCYNSMFDGCTSLITAPTTLPATTLVRGCYMGMFRNCDALTTAPTMYVTTVDYNCCDEMFNGCDSLINIPIEIPITTAAYGCFRGMFEGCDSLNSTFALPATTLADYCYHNMYWGCTSLTTAPTLPANSIITESYSGMFYNCSSLKSITCLGGVVVGQDGTKDWVRGVSSTGTFTKKSTKNWESYPGRGVSGIPTNWTIRNVS